MARPQNKETLLALSEQLYQKILSLVDKQETAIATQKASNGWTMKDVVAHLSAWHKLFLGWYEQDRQGVKPELPAPGYTWKTMPHLNEKIYQENKDRTLPEVIAEFQQTYAAVRKVIQSHSNEELFTKKKFAWTGSTSLGSYLTSCTSSHYDWALQMHKEMAKK
jgi:hypothetical protein